MVNLSLEGTPRPFDKLMARDFTVPDFARQSFSVGGLLPKTLRKVNGTSQLPDSAGIPRLAVALAKEGTGLPVFVRRSFNRGGQRGTYEIVHSV